MYVTDTHALIYYVEQKLTRLGKTARHVFENAGQNETVIYVPTAVLWEIGRRLAQGKLVFPVTFDHWCRGLERAEGFSIAALEWQDVSAARSLPFNDPFDCLIAGTAVHLGIPLITKDSEIRDSGLVETIW